MTSELEPKSLGIGFGGVFALYLFLAALAAQFLGYGVEMVELMSGLYAGYGTGILGSVVGALWGFVDGFIIGFLVASFYNKANEKFSES